MTKDEKIAELEFMLRQITNALAIALEIPEGDISAENAAKLRRGWKGLHDTLKVMDFNQVQ